MATQNERIQQTVEREQKRLFRFIRERVPQEADAEDILQDVFYQFVNSYRLMEPIEQAASWLFRVASNKITDWYRKKKPQPFSSFTATDEDGEELSGPEFMLFDPDGGPEMEYLRSMVWDELEAALDELPAEQREVFIRHELEDKSFKEISEETGVAVNTLLSRKRYAVLYLRKRLQDLYEDLLNN